MKKLVSILLPCILAFIFCLGATIISLVDYTKGEAFADITFSTYMILSILVLLLDLVTKKMTKLKKVLLWPLQVGLILGLWLLTHAVVSDMFKAGV